MFNHFYETIMNQNSLNLIVGVCQVFVNLFRKKHSTKGMCRYLLLLAHPLCLTWIEEKRTRFFKKQKGD